LEFARGISVVIPTRNRAGPLEASIASVLRLGGPLLEVVVVDNEPDDESAAEVARRHGVRYMRLAQRGLGRARNAGARAARGSIVAFLDDDMIPHPAWLDALSFEFEHEESIAATSGPVMPMAMLGVSDSALQEKLERWPRGPRRFSVHRSQDYWFERANFGGISQGALAFRRSLFDSWGFDESIGRGMMIDCNTETYAFFSLLDRGLRVSYSPRAIVFHPDQPTHLQARLHNVTQMGAYACHLVARHPRYALATAKYFVEGFFGKRREWKEWISDEEPEPMPRMLAVKALLAGPLVYARSLAQARRKR
jgi:O-antigen biosynthesis protein